MIWFPPILIPNPPDCIQKKSRFGIQKQTLHVSTEIEFGQSLSSQYFVVIGGGAEDLKIEHL